ncbi:hypothetical protein TNIN_456821 [Trichonephila inaurata madagascariensis]|uniref:Uncharacterized protein n=1 Tax=Trichonephila inaurata madagascariensis TaxID=2747483 RepID=A0A8X7CT71_9ARAC|nr:hypothetical protein TNIN_456821 [Trichonephila inaurata madagascariensis]
MWLEKPGEEFYFDFEDFRRYLLLKSLSASEIRQEIKTELETMINPDYLEIELMTQKIRTYFFLGEYENVFQTIGEMLHGSEKKPRNLLYLDV